MARWCIIFIIFLFTSCTCNSKRDNKGLGLIQGVWLQNSLPYEKDLIEYKRNQFTFKCDSFYLLIKNYSSVKLSTDSCYKKRNWEEYVKGVYKFNNDTIFLKGSYVNNMYRLKTNGCYNNGTFEETFIVVDSTKNYLKIKSFSKGLISFKKIKENICN